MPGGIEPPISVVLSWPKANLVDPEARGSALDIVVAALGPLSILTCFVRLYSRICLTKTFGLDDWTLLVAMIPTTGFTASVMLSVHSYGFGYHVWDLVDISNPHVLLDIRKISFANEMLYLFASALIKSSILLFYLRLADGARRDLFVYSTWILGFSIIAYLFASVSSLFATCHPFSGFWYRILPWWRITHPQACVDEGAAVLAFSIISAIQDCFVALLPVLLFLRLTLSLRHKSILGMIFGFGLVTCAAAIVRIVYLKQVFYDTWDATWVMYDVWLWMVVEVLLGSICANGPALRIVLLHCLNSYSGSVLGTHQTPQSLHSPMKRVLRERSEEISLDDTESTAAVDDNERTTCVRPTTSADATTFAMLKLSIPEHSYEQGAIITKTGTFVSMGIC